MHLLLFTEVPDDPGFARHVEIDRVIEGLLRNGDAALDLRDDVYERYNTGLDAANRRMAWGAAEVSGWYKNAAGRARCPGYLSP